MRSTYWTREHIAFAIVSSLIMASASGEVLQYGYGPDNARELHMLSVLFQYGSPNRPRVVGLELSRGSWPILSAYLSVFLVF